MTIEQVIQKAIEGGYERTKRNYTRELGRFHVCEIVLDPLFWQALGKSMGWNGVNHLAPEMPTWRWREYLHDFLDHIADGGTIESYFEQL